MLFLGELVVWHQKKLPLNWWKRNVFQFCRPNMLQKFVPWTKLILILWILQLEVVLVKYFVLNHEKQFQNVYSCLTVSLFKMLLIKEGKILWRNILYLETVSINCLLKCLMFIPLVLCDQLECVVENCDWIIYFFITLFAIYCFFILYVAAYMANKVVYLNVLHVARWKYRMQKTPKIRHLGTITQFYRAVSLQLRHILTIGKNTC